MPIRTWLPGSVISTISSSRVTPVSALRGRCSRWPTSVWRTRRRNILIFRCSDEGIFQQIVCIQKIRIFIFRKRSGCGDCRRSRTVRQGDPHGSRCRRSDGESGFRMELQKLRTLELQKLYQTQQLQHLEQQLVQYIIFHLNMQGEDIQMLNQIFIH